MKLILLTVLLLISFEAPALLQKQVNDPDTAVLHELDELSMQQQSYARLADSLERLHRYREAYIVFQKYVSVTYQLMDKKRFSDLSRRELQFEFVRKQLSDSLHQVHKLRVNELKVRRQRSFAYSISGVTGIMTISLLLVLRQRNRIRQAKKYSDELLLNILPAETAMELKATGKAQARSFELVTVMFTDFKDFTRASELLNPEELVKEINYCFGEFDQIITRFGIEKIKTIGDSYMCAGGLPVPNITHPADVVNAGLEIQRFMARNNLQRQKNGLPFFELRLGIHSGPVIAGIVGIKKFAYDIWGDTVNTASRMESSGETGRVNISRTTYDLVKNYFVCEYRGRIGARNKGEMDMYFVISER